MVRRAERFLIDNAVAPITVSDLADHLGISLRSLQAGFVSGAKPPPPRS
jgi:transcriptional regulator GlxA family with amidase domain